ncbi:MAG: DUF4249 family protein [Prolixibacteraceae bacterium]
MTDENGQVVKLVFDSLYNVYRADVVPGSNQTYVLEVICDSFPTVVVEDVLPVKVALDSVQIDPFVRVDNLGAAIGQAIIYFKDPLKSENYYEVEITPGYNNYSGLVVSSEDPVITNEFYYPENAELQNFSPHRLLFSDQSFGSGQKVITVSFYSGSSYYCSEDESYHRISEGYITVKFRSVSKNYYTYFASYLNYMFNISGEALLGTVEPVNIMGNVKGGYGIFGAYQEVYYQTNFEGIKY